MTPGGWLGLFGSSPILRLLLAILAADLVKGTFLLLLAALAVRRPLRNHPARAGTAWLACLLALVALPLAWLWLPPLRTIPVPPGDPGRGQSLHALRLLTGGVLPGLRNISGADAARVSLAGRGLGPGVRVLGSLIEGTWLTGAVLGLARLIEGTRRVLTLAVLPPGPALAALAEEVRSDLGVSRPVRVERSPACGMPFTFGIRVPRIVLPAAASEWPPDRLRAVLLHEMAHIRRRDSLSGWAASLITAVLWFLPPAWVAASRLRAAQERSADEVVLSRGVRAEDYARTLLEIGRSCPGGLVVPGTQSMFGRRGMLKRRIEGILELGEGPGARAGNRRAAWVLRAFCLAAALSVFTCAAPLGKLEGTWAPEAGSRNPYKYAYPADGKCLAFTPATSSIPSMEGRYKVEKKWSDPDGSTWYRLDARWSVGAYDEASASQNRWFILIRIDPDGTRMESQASTSGFPESLNPSDRWYGTHRKI